MSPAFMAFTGAGVLFVIAVGTTVGLIRAVTANNSLVRELDRTQNQLDTYRAAFGEPAPFLIFMNRLVDPSPGKDELR